MGLSSFPVCVRGTEPRCCLQVWSLRCAIHVLDHGGNLIDASSVAAVASLLHFRRPDVSVSGETVTVHSVADRAPVPLSIHHIPVCVTFAIFDGVRVGVACRCDLRHRGGLLDVLAHLWLP